MAAAAATLPRGAVVHVSSPTGVRSGVGSSIMAHRSHVGPSVVFRFVVHCALLLPTECQLRVRIDVVSTLLRVADDEYESVQG